MSGINQIFAVGGARPRIHAYETDDHAVFDSHANSFANTRFYTVDGRELNPTFDQAGALTRLTANGAGPGTTEVQNRITAAIGEIRTRVQVHPTLPATEKGVAIAQLDALQGMTTLAQRYASLQAKPLGHVLPPGYAATVGAAAAAAGPGAGILHRNGWLHNLLNH